MARKNGRKPKSPAYQWYPSDAAIDENYRLLDDAERGNFHTLYDFAWMNDGIPQDIESVAALLGRDVELMRARWIRLGKCWVPHPKKPGRLVNARQERERKSRAAFRLAMSKNGLKGGRPRKPAAFQQVSETEPEGKLPIPIPIPNPSLSQSASFLFEKFPRLDTPEMRAAVDAWIANERAESRPAWSARRWETNAKTWDDWGAAVAAKAIWNSIQTGAKTPHVHAHDPSARRAAETPARAPAATETREEADLRARWNLLQSRLVRDGKSKGIPPYPGHAKAKTELDG